METTEKTVSAWAVKTVYDQMIISYFSFCKD
jgi:hypothetical protein